MALAVGVVLGGVASATAPVGTHEVGVGAQVALSADRAPAPSTLDAGVVVDRVEASVLRADVEACGWVRQGTVTMVDSGVGVLGLTNAHVVEGGGELQVSGAGSGVSTATVLAYPIGRDAAEVDLGGLDVESGAALPLGPAPEEGDEVVVAGFPAGRWSARAGVVRSVERRHARGASSAVMVIDVDAARGISGGVVADAAGRAVGLVAARDPRTGFTVAYPLDEVLGRSAGPVPGC